MSIVVSVNRRSGFSLYISKSYYINILDVNNIKTQKIVELK
ncbi:MAG: hypothetical protein N2053_00300 [Chitinispirillaceae bacterium]|nr:hypothetical protein [Chitinispirillaceae bacterium]